VAEYVDTVWQEAHLRILAGREEPPRVHLLRFNSAQRRLNAVVREEFRKKRPIRLIICKARQEGVSTWVEALIYARCRLVPDQSGVILSHDPEGTANLYSMYQRYLDHDEAHPPTRFSSMKGLTFAPPHNSQVVVQTAAKRFAGTGQTHQMAHLSELAKWAFPEETMLSLMQAIPDIPESLVIIESTAYGAGGYFHEQWEAAVAGESGWRPVFLPWYIHAEYCLDLPARDLDEALEDFGTHDRYNFYPGEEDDLVARFALTRGQLAWRRRAIDIKCGGDVLFFRQEYPATSEESFITSGSPRFAMRTLQTWYDNAIEPSFVGSMPLDISKREADIRLLEGEGDWLKIWGEIDTTHRHVLFADCAGSNPGGDHNTATVMDISSRPWKLVATIWGLRGADIYARAIANVGHLFGTCLVGVEVNGIGEACQSHLRHWYPERALYHRLPIDRAVRKPGDRIGFYTGHITRHNLIEDLDSAIRDETIEIPDMDTILELLAFQRLPGPRNGEARPGSKDDRVFALGGCLQIASYSAAGEYQQYREERHKQSTPPMMEIPA